MSHISQELQAAYILHTRPYRDTSLLIEFFTEHDGRIAAVAKGARGQRSSWRGLLMPGMPLLITCKGKHDLLTLTQAEPNGPPLLLQGQALFSQFYLNELLLYILHRHDPHPHLFALYAQTLKQLAKCEKIEIPLRLFEIDLVREMGYGAHLTVDASSHQPVESDAWYRLDLHEGIIRADNAEGAYSGQLLLALSQRTLEALPTELLRQAKRLTRQMLDYLLEGKEIRSRELFS